MGSSHFNSKIEHNIITDFSVSEAQSLSIHVLEENKGHMHLEIIRLANIKMHKLRTFQGNHFMYSRLQIPKKKKKCKPPSLYQMQYNEKMRLW